ncbi:MAG: PQQ-binding-like beta-propeller repeat protein [Planctomycetota bacterium]
MTLSDRSHADSRVRLPRRCRSGGLLAAGLLLAGLGLTGCATTSDSGDATAPVQQTLPAGSFVAEWTAPLRMRGATPVSIEKLGDHIVVTDSANRAYSLTAGGGTLEFARTIVDSDESLQKPVMIERQDADDLIVFPSAATLVRITTGGRALEPVSLNFAVTGPAVAAEGRLFAGVAAVGAAGQVGAIDPLRPYGNITWRRVVFGSVLAQPVVFEGVLYVPTATVRGTDRGRVYAISIEKRASVWKTAFDEKYFETFGGNTVGLVADEFGLYVASDDTQLYVIDRNSGALKWRYYAGTPLEASPAVLSNTVYQPVAGRGLVALAKIGDDVVREPTWVSSSAESFVASDDDHIYALGTDGRLLGLDIETGAVKFASERSDFVEAFVNTEDGTIFAATRGGEIIRAKANLKPGGTGQKI